LNWGTPSYWKIVWRITLVVLWEKHPTHLASEILGDYKSKRVREYSLVLLKNQTSIWAWYNLLTMEWYLNFVTTFDISSTFKRLLCLRLTDTVISLTYKCPWKDRCKTKWPHLPLFSLRHISIILTNVCMTSGNFIIYILFVHDRKQLNIWNYLDLSFRQLA
jgi:hypothetical protein